MKLAPLRMTPVNEKEFHDMISRPYAPLKESNETKCHFFIRPSISLPAEDYVKKSESIRFLINKFQVIPCVD